jgi:hypothetical protein
VGALRKIGAGALEFGLTPISVVSSKLGGALRRFPASNIDRRHMMHGFKIGDHVSWNSEAGRVSGTIIRVHRSDFDVRG